MFGQPKPLGPALPFTPEQLAVTRDGMFLVVNGHGTGVGSKLPLDGIQMAGKTGTAQVRAMISRGSVSDWKARDHSLFVCYAPADKPKYAMAVVVEHGGFGASAAAPIAKDVMTCLFDPAKAWADLTAREKTWGGTPSERLAAKYAAYTSQYGTTAPKVASDAAVEAALTQTAAIEPPAPTSGVTTGAERGEASVPRGGAATSEATPGAAPTPTPSAGPPN
jgi:penicillin-binding protein 2